MTIWGIEDPLPAENSGLISLALTNSSFQPDDDIDRDHHRQPGVQRAGQRHRQQLTGDIDRPPYRISDVIRAGLTGVEDKVGRDTGHQGPETLMGCYMKVVLPG